MTTISSESDINTTFVPFSFSYHFIYHSYTVSWVCKVFGMNIPVTIVVRGLRAPPSFLTSMAGHGDPALQWMVRS